MRTPIEIEAEDHRTAAAGRIVVTDRQGRFFRRPRIEHRNLLSEKRNSCYRSFTPPTDPESLGAARVVGFGSGRKNLEDVKTDLDLV
jgi:hypothetical protein